MTLPEGNGVTRCSVALSDVEAKHTELSAVRESARRHAKPSAIANAVPIEELTKAKGCRVGVIRMDVASRLAGDDPPLRSVGPFASLGLMDTMLPLWLGLNFLLVGLGFLCFG
jgi:hypothetical protein